MNKPKIDIIIPARLNSSRLPRKVLLKLGNKTMLERVYENFKIIEGELINKIYIAVDSIELFEIVNKFCKTENIILTSEKHLNGTSRISEAILKTNSDFVINIQADEPFITSNTISPIISNIIKNDDYDVLSTYSKIFDLSELNNTNLVKVVLDNQKNALYFSRSPIPFFREEIANDYIPLKHHGIYAYKRSFFEKYPKLTSGVLSKVESLEQLQILENGYKIKMVEIECPFKGIDNYDDYLLAKKYFEEQII